MGPLTFEAAQEILVSSARHLGQEEVSVASALGRVAAGGLASPHPLPPFATSAVDGYAVMGTAAGPRRLAGRRLAGDPPWGDIAEGTSIFVATGAVVPDGAGVAWQEDATVEDGNVRLSAWPEPGANVRQRGEEVGEGAPILAAGDRIDAGAVALLAAVGVRTVTVARRPRILVVATGTELLREGPPEPGRIVNTNGPWLRAQAEHLGAEVWEAMAEDRPEALEEAVGSAPDVDVVVTSGGASKGPKDQVMEVAGRLGFAPLFRGVKARPASPVAALRHADGTIWAALPGNPLATALGWDHLVRPLVAAMEGRPFASGLVPARLTASLGGNPKAVPRYWPAHLRTGADGLEATPFPYGASGSVSALKGMNAWIRMPAGSSRSAPGDRVELLAPEGAAP